jgi:predicted transcriptional regulator
MNAYLWAHFLTKKEKQMRSKRSESARSSSEGTPTTPEGEALGPRGVNWLRYAGVGPARARSGGKKEKISGENVTSLGGFEAEVMGILWEIGDSATAMEVMETSLYRRRSQGLEPASFATIATTLRRLADKGLLRTEKGDTRTPYYAPTVGREEMAARILNNVSVTLLGQTLHGLIPRLVGGIKPAGRGAKEQADAPQDIERLKQALQDAAARSGGAGEE